MSDLFLDCQGYECFIQPVYLCYQSQSHGLMQSSLLTVLFRLAVIGVSGAAAGFQYTI